MSVFNFGIITLYKVILCHSFISRECVNMIVLAVYLRKPLADLAEILRGRLDN